MDIYVYNECLPKRIDPSYALSCIDIVTEKD
jgi:hypothetical protein